MRQEITTTKGDGDGTIDELINFLNKAKEKGATNYSFRWSGDPMWAFKWFETYRIKSQEELDKEKKEYLENELRKLNEK